MDAMGLAVGAVAIGSSAVGVLLYVVRAEASKKTDAVATDASKKIGDVATACRDVAAALKAHVDGCEIRERQHDERHKDVRESLKLLHEKFDRIVELR